MNVQKVSITQLHLLPDCPGIYLVYLDDRVLYIGKSKNIRNRWKNHHRFTELLSKYPNCVISWIEYPIELLTINESAMIRSFNPVLNSTPVTQWDSAIKNSTAKSRSKVRNFLEDKEQAEAKYNWLNDLPKYLIREDEKLECLSPYEAYLCFPDWWMEKLKQKAIETGCFDHFYRKAEGY